MAIVYVLTNPVFENFVKVGRTINLEQRLRQLDNTSVPLPFRCVFAVEVEDDVKVERLLHLAFADHRTRSTREFFEIDPQRVISALKLTGGKDVTPRGDIAEDEEGIRAIEDAARRRRKTYKFSDAGIYAGDVLTYVNDDQISVQVIGEKKVLFEGKETSLSQSALVLLQRDGYTWQTVNGWRYWMIDGETVAERLGRFLADTYEPDA